LIGDSGEQWGWAFRSNDESTNPMIISLGHKISNETALKIVKLCTIHRIPQPIRFSDKISRRLIAEYENFINYLKFIYYILISIIIYELIKIQVKNGI
jgi:hypothetical protein